MQIRHRVPTVFTLYMVDVLCCALGCVILLWFLKIHEARQHDREAQRYEKKARETSERLADIEQRLIAKSQESQQRGQEADRTRTSLEKTQAKAAALARLLADTQGQLARATAERDKLQKDRDAAAAQVAQLTKDIDLARKQRTTAEARLHEQEIALREAGRNADALTSRLQDADARLKEMAPLAAAVPGLRQEASDYRERLAALQTKMTSLQGDIAARGQELAGADKSLRNLEETNRRLRRELAAQNSQLAGAERNATRLQDENKSLLELSTRQRAAQENRFAGITLTGRRVVFIVDMSGSMELVDLQTAAPDKWVAVRETLGKVMRSLPDLQKFQIVIFSERANYLLDGGADWIDFKGQASVDQAVEALSKVKPEGNTNMYVALEAAFRFRPAGLDTIYLLSDGLPNIGPGLSAEQAQTMTEDQRSIILSRFIRRKLLTDWNPKNANARRVRLNTIGFFFESPDVGAFLWALARENEGSFVGMSKP